MTLRDFYLKRAKAEFPVFLKVLRALPSDLSYKPDERSPSAEQLVWTLTYEMKALIDVVETGKSEWQNITPPGLDEMIGMYEKWSTELLDKVAIHHRGQLSAYLRPMGGKVPSIYGLAIGAVLLLVFLCVSLRASAASALKWAINAEVRRERRDNLFKLRQHLAIEKVGPIRRLVVGERAIGDR